MKAIALSLFALTFTAAACTSSDPGKPAPPPEPTREPEADASDGTPNDSAPPAQGQPPASAPDGSSSETPKELPEQPPGLVGTWESYESHEYISITRTLFLFADGTARVEDLQEVDEPGSPFHYAFEACSWRVSGDEQKPTPKGPWILQMLCDSPENKLTYEVLAIGERVFTANNMVFPTKFAVTFDRQE